MKLLLHSSLTSLALASLFVAPFAAAQETPEDDADFEVPASSAPSAPQPTTSAAPAPAAGPATSESWEQLAGEARAAYHHAIEAQRAGDWAKYGEELRALGEALERMRRQ